MSSRASGDQLWQPSTFLERGVAVPFTTPVLAGTRARPSAPTVELIVPHPAGARGVYIMAWSELPNFCAATLHDRLLSERLALLPSVTPRDIREAARDVAAVGAAGRGAKSAAEGAAMSDRHERLLINVLLLQLLVEQVFGNASAPAELDRQAKAAIVRIAPRIGRVPETITNDIEALAALYAGLGTGAQNDRARCPRLLGAIELTLMEVQKFADGCGGESAVAARLVTAGAEVTLALARRTLGEAVARLDDLPALLAAWAADSAEIAAMLTRTEWLLDGWEQICAMWKLAQDGTRRGAISEMALMVPVIPREAGDWFSASIDEGERQRLRRLVHSYEDWRTGSVVFDLISRNEQIRALAA